MKALAFKVQKTEKESFNIQVDDLPYFYNRLHQHPELQITLIQEGEGALIVGDSIGSFKGGELLLIGSNVPHWFKNEVHYFDKQSKLRARSISLFFREDSFGTSFFQLPEMTQIKEVFIKAQRGILVKGKDRENIIQQLNHIEKLTPVNRLLALIQMLQQIAESEEWEYLSNITFDPREIFSESDNEIFQYVMDHYHKPIQLEKIAQLSNSSVSSFCRNFKLRTQKTFIQFVNEIRIGAACKLLREKENSIATIAYEVGFNNISNFNRQFKRVTGFTPTQYFRKF